MLEIVLTVFSLLCLITGVSLIASLAITCYLPYAFLRYSALLLKNTKNPQAEKITPTFDEQPVIIKKDVKEKE